MGRWWRYKWITFHPSLTHPSAVFQPVRLTTWPPGEIYEENLGINNDISAFLAEHPETELTMDEWLCAMSCITSRRVYLQRTAFAGVPRYGLDGHPKGQVSESEAQSAGRRLATLEQNKSGSGCRHSRRIFLSNKHS